MFDQSSLKLHPKLAPKYSVNLGGKLDTELSLKDASKLAGKTTTAIRSWINKKEIEARKIQGKWVINTDSLKQHLATKVRPNLSKSSEESSSNTQNLELTKDYISTLTSSLEREQKKVDQLTSQVEKLQSELLKLTHEMQAVLKNESGNKLSRWIKDVVS